MYIRLSKDILCVVRFVSETGPSLSGLLVLLALVVREGISEHCMGGPCGKNCLFNMSDLNQHISAQYMSSLWREIALLQNFNGYQPIWHFLADHPKVLCRLVPAYVCLKQEVLCLQNMVLYV